MSWDVSLCFSPALALGQVQLAALAEKQLLLSALLDFEDFPSPSLKPAPGNWSGPDFSCSAFPWEGCEAGRRRAGAGELVAAGGGGGGAGGAGAAELTLPSSGALNKNSELSPSEL